MKEKVGFKNVIVCSDEEIQLLSKVLKKDVVKVVVPSGSDELGNVLKHSIRINGYEFAYFPYWDKPEQGINCNVVR